MLFDSASLVAAGGRGLMGWTADFHYLPYVAYLGIVPGVVGHTGGRQDSREVAAVAGVTDGRPTAPAVEPLVDMCPLRWPACPLQASTRCCAT